MLFNIDFLLLEFVECTKDEIRNPPPIKIEQITDLIGLFQPRRFKGNRIYIVL